LNYLESYSDILHKETSRHNNSDWTPLMCSVSKYNGHYITQLLLDAHANPNIHSHNGCSALHILLDRRYRGTREAHCVDTDAAEQLIAAGAHFYTSDQKRARGIAPCRHDHIDLTIGDRLHRAIIQAMQKRAQKAHTIINNVLLRNPTLLKLSHTH